MFLCVRGIIQYLQVSGLVPTHCTSRLSNKATNRNEILERERLVNLKRDSYKQSLRIK